MGDVFVAFVSMVLYIIAVFQRARGSREVPGMRWWYMLSIPLGLALAYNQFLTMFDRQLPPNVQSAIRVLVISIIWIGPTVTGRIKNPRR